MCNTTAWWFSKAARGTKSCAAPNVLSMQVARLWPTSERPRPELLRRGVGLNPGTCRSDHYLIHRPRFRARPFGRAAPGGVEMTMAEDVQRAKWQRVRATNATPMYEQ